MGGILQAIESSAISTIESCDMKWRVRKICSADLARVGHAALAVAQGMEAPSGMTESKNDADVMSKIAAAPAKQLETMAKLKDAVVAAGLIAVGDPVTGEWEDVKPTLEVEKADARSGTIWVGSLPAEVSEAIFTEVMSLSTDGGRSLERLRQFRARARNAADPGPGGEALRPVAE
mgnify:CR=1 FL=1